MDTGEVVKEVNENAEDEEAQDEDESAVEDEDEEFSEK